MTGRSEAEDLARWASQAEVDRLKAMIQELRAENEWLRALLARWRQCFAHLRPLTDSTLEQDTDAALAVEKP